MVITSIVFPSQLYMLYKMESYYILYFFIPVSFSAHKVNALAQVKDDGVYIVSQNALKKITHGPQQNDNCTITCNVLMLQPNATKIPHITY